MNKLEALRDRADMMARARAFFAERKVMEVDCPLLLAAPSIDAHIDLIRAEPYDGTRWLHTSPEYCMKRLLSEGIGDIYQLGHVFRDGECGVKHNPEFMMAEWYRVGMSYEEMIQETVDFVRLFVAPLPIKSFTYRDAFKHFVGIDYHTSSEADLLEYIRINQIPVYDSLHEEGKDALLNLILASKVEPLLGKDEICVLKDYPASQGALARTHVRDGEPIAERFEIYINGLELANGYHELVDHVEQRRRFKASNEHRLALGKKSLPIDENFLLALETGIPDCCGVAVGFDRLMMLRHRTNRIGDVLTFSW